MIKWFKDGNVVKTNIIEPYWLKDGNGNKFNQLPTDIEELRTKTIDTLNWLIGQTVKQNTGGDDYTKLSAANSKAVVLLTKLITSLSPDTSNLSAKEMEAFTKLQALADSGYADSDLLNRSLDAIINNIQKYTTLIDQAVKATTIEELVEILESV